MIDPKRKFMLFRKNKNFCSVPWNLLYVGTNGRIKTCTRGAIILDNAHDNDIEDILANKKIQEMKSCITKDTPIVNCRACTALENNGTDENDYGHLRNMYNEMFVNQTINYDNVNEFVLGAVDLHWSGICDLKCITCWAVQSSSIAVEQGVPIQHTKTETALKIIDFIVKNQKTLKEVYLSGGEPTLIKYNLNLLEQLEKRDDLLIRVNSNLMWDTDNAIVKEILKFPNVMFTCSADNLDQKFEYIRRGANWQRFVSNLKYLSTFANVKLRINSVFFVLSAFDLLDTIDYFYTNFEINDYTINQCYMGHTYYRCRNLKSSSKEKVKLKLMQAKEKYTDNLNLVGCLNNCLAELENPATEFYNQPLDDVDFIAKTDWKERFPELI